MTKTMEDYWFEVEEYLQDARLIAWDTCHKIYLAMDEEQEEWFVENYAPDYFRGTPKQMLATLHEWWDASCGLRFIQSVTTNHADPNDGFDSLIPQFTEEDDEDYDY